MDQLGAILSYGTLIIYFINNFLKVCIPRKNLN